MFTTDEAERVLGGQAWLQAMLDVEAGLARAQARAGIVPAQAAADIERCCRVELFDAASIAQRAVGSATPVIALTRDLGALVDESTKPHVHKGATSQDVLDTAAMLVARNALALIEQDLRAATEECARLTAEHRDTPMIGRSLLQQALPTTFGRRCAGWLHALGEAADRLGRLRREQLAVQLGGPTGTLASLGTSGTRVLALLAEELDLNEPVLPWHTDRSRVAALAGALGTASGALAKTALDVKLHAQTEVGELAEGSAGGSSAMPHKQNPVGSVLVTAATERVPGLVSTLLAAMPQEHERAAGAWQAEWEPLTELLRLVAAAAAHTRDLLGGLRVDTGAMARNLALTGGLIMAESAAAALADQLGRTEAQDLVGQLSRRAVERGTTLREELLAEPRVRDVLSEQDVVATTEPEDYLGSAGEFVDRALRAHRERSRAWT